MKDDEWQTPDALYDKLCDMYDFNPILDASANLGNTKCKHFLDDAMYQSWNFKGDVWCNPPHSKPNLTNFVERAEEMHLSHGIRILMIVPANFGGTATFHKYIQRKRFYEFVEGRPSFLKKGRILDSSRNAYIVIIWGKSPLISDLVLAHEGEVSK